MLEVAMVVLVAALGARPMHKSPSTAPTDAKAFSYDFAQPQRVEVGGTGPTRVSAMTQMPMPVWGYGILPVTIDNSTGPSQTVRVRYLSNAGGGSRTVEKSVDVHTGEVVQFGLPIPSALRYGRLQVRAAGVVEGSEPQVYFSYLYRPQRAALAIGAPEDFEKLAGQRPVNTDPAVMVTTIAPGQSPQELAAYVGYDVVAVAAGVLEELPPGTQRALEAYAATGGTLVIREVGRGTLAALPLLLAPQSSGGHVEYGFGEVSLAEQSPGLDGAFFRGGARVTPQGARPNYVRRGFGGGADADAVLLPQALAPLGRFLIIIVLFTLAIGPGSFWVARRRGPGVLLITIPGTAFVTCALIIGYSLIRDGFTVHASAHGYSLLDAPRNRVITVGMGAFYANLAPGKAVFPASTAVIAPFENGGEQQGVGLSWNEGARYGSDFLPSRSYREWGVIGVEATRARLVVKGTGSDLKVQNALGSRITRVYLKWKGQLWEAGEVRDGGEVALKHVVDNFEPNLDPMPESRFEDVTVKRVEQPLQDLEFVATLDGPAFVQLGGLRLSHHDSTHRVRGTVHE